MGGLHHHGRAQVELEESAPPVWPAAENGHVPLPERGQEGVLEFVDLTAADEDLPCDALALDPATVEPWDDVGDWATNTWLEEMDCEGEYAEANGRPFPETEDAPALAGDCREVNAVSPAAGDTHAMDDAQTVGASPMEGVLVPCATTSGGIMLHRSVPASVVLGMSAQWRGPHFLVMKWPLQPRQV